MKDAVVNAFQFNLTYAQLLLKDIDDEQMAEQPMPAMNHPIWIIGHLANTGDFIGSLLDLQATSAPNWKDLFGGGSTPTSDRARYLTKSTLIKALGNGHERVSKAYLGASREQLEASLANERLRPHFPTTGELVVFALTGYEMIHLGQLSAWRRARGLPSVLS